MKVVDFDAVYETTNYGKYKVIKDYGTVDGRHRVRIKFLYTGYEIDIRDDYIGHNIIDPYYPRIYGVACKGNAYTRRYGNKRHYDRWIKMISRCYNPVDKDYKRYGAIGVTVSEEWKCFENYLRDIQLLEGYDRYLENPFEYNLDKDILQSHLPKGQRVYSKDTCKWVHYSENTSQRTMDKEGMVNKYHGVYKGSSGYYSYFRLNNNRINVGRFDTAEMAANAHNYYMQFLGLTPLNPNVEYMPPEVFSKHNQKMKTMFHNV